MRWFSLLLLLAFSFALTPAIAQQQDPKPKPKAQSEPQGETLKFETNLVVVNVTITDGKEHYISGLKRDDFNLFEDKSPQKILDFSSEETPFSVVILLDASGSMQHKLTLARAACANFVDTLRVDDTFAIYGFSGMKVKTLQDFTEVHDIPDSVWDMRADGETPLYDAITKAAEALAKRPERRRAILVVSDGADTKSKSSLDQTLRKALDAQVAIYGVDLSDTGVYKTQPRDNGAEIMKEMTLKTGGRFFSSAGGGQLREAFNNAAEELRHQYTLTYESTNERYDGRWRTIEVKLAKPQYTVRSRPGYYGRKKSG